MRVKVVETTDGKYLGMTFDVPEVSKEVALLYGIEADKILEIDNYFLIINSNFTIKLKKLKER